MVYGCIGADFQDRELGTRVFGSVLPAQPIENGFRVNYKDSTITHAPRLSYCSEYGYDGLGLDRKGETVPLSFVGLTGNAWQTVDLQ